MGGFTIAYNLTIACHELGHSFAVLLDGGRIREFYLNPFSWSWNLGQNLSNPVFTAWGGVTFGLLFALLPVILLIRSRKSFIRIPTLILAGSAFLINGIYLIMGMFLNIGDGVELIGYGVPRFIIGILGILYILIALFGWNLVQQGLGFDASSSVARRLIILAFGIAPYLFLIFLYNLLVNPDIVMVWLSFAMVGVLCCFIFSLVGHLTASFFPSVPKPAPASPSLGPPLLFLSFGLIIIAAEFLIFGIKESPF